MLHTTTRKSKRKYAKSVTKPITTNKLPSFIFQKIMTPTCNVMENTYYSNDEHQFHKNYYCINCNSHGHTNKTCDKSIISNGIIAFHVQGMEMTDEMLRSLSRYINANLRVSQQECTKNDYKAYNIFKNHANDNKITEPINKNIKFLIVQRKNSLGYIEFIRGKYHLSNLSTVLNLFEQMTQTEIDDILTKSYEELWNDLWNISDVTTTNNNKSITKTAEYNKAKGKFEDLRKNYRTIILNVKRRFEFNEWGFPKGRREPYESDMVCAIREFEEETKQGENTYTMLEDGKQIRENMIGTNDVYYIHNYYLAYLKENKLRFDGETDKIREIGDIRLLDVNSCLELFRPYHYNKINVIKNVYNVINGFCENVVNTQVTQQI
jgi:8-oxo-dGTP pyrophosphatase MutT (NUDIX family)